MDERTQEEEILSCSICLETMREPKVLPCLHRFCESCLDNHITASATRASGVLRGFSCPACREFVPARDARTPPSTWAAGFRTDFLVNHLIELFWSRQEHKNNKPPISHPCLEHEDTELDLYCYDCTQTVCHVCAATAHHNCNRLVTVKKAAQDCRSLMYEKIDEIHSIIEEALTRKTARERYMKEVHEKVMTEDIEIRKSALKLQEHINEQKELLLKELHKHYEVMQQNVSADALKLTDSLNQLQDLVKTTTLKIASIEDTNFLSLTSVNAVIDSYNRQCIALNKQYDSLCGRICDVKCRFESVRSPCISLGSVLFLSESNKGHSPDDTTPSVSQNARTTPGTTASQSSSQTVLSAQQPILSSSGSQSTKSTLGPVPSASGSQTMKSTLGPVPSTSGSQTIKSTLGPVPSTSGSQTTKSTLGPVPSTSGSQTIKSTLGPVPSTSGSQTIKSTLGPVPSTSASQGVMSTQKFASRVKRKNATYLKTSKMGPMRSSFDTSDSDTDRPVKRKKNKSWY